MFEATKKMILMFEEIKGMVNTQLETLSQMNQLHGGHQSPEKERTQASK